MQQSVSAVVCNRNCMVHITFVHHAATAPRRGAALLGAGTGRAPHPLMGATPVPAFCCLLHNAQMAPKRPYPSSAPSKAQRTGPLARGGVAAGRASRLLDVVGPLAAATAQRVRLVIPLTYKPKQSVKGQQWRTRSLGPGMPASPRAAMGAPPRTTYQSYRYPCRTSPWCQRLLVEPC